MSKILVFGEFNSDNIGDVLLGESQLYVYGKNNLNVSLATFGSDCERGRSKDKRLEFSTNNFLKKIHRWCYSRFFVYRHAFEMNLFWLKRMQEYKSTRNKLQDIDVVIIGGGQLFSDNSLRMLLHIYCITKTAIEFGLDIKIIGSGVPTPKSFISKYLMAKIFSFYDKQNVYLRDQKSIYVVNEISSLKLDKKNIIPDFAISYVAELNNSFISSRNRTIGLAPIGIDCLPYSQRSMVYNCDNWWIALAELIKNNGYIPVLFCHGTQIDYKRCLEVQDEAKKRGLSIDVLPRPECVEEYLSMVYSFENVLAQRLHVSIAAFSLGKLPVSLPWDDKVKCFYDEAGLEQNFVEFPDNNHEYIFSLLLKTSATQSNLQKLVNRTGHVVTQQLSGYSNE